MLAFLGGKFLSPLPGLGFHGRGTQRSRAGLLSCGPPGLVRGSLTKSLSVRVFSQLHPADSIKESGGRGRTGGSENLEIRPKT